MTSNGTGAERVDAYRRDLAAAARKLPRATRRELLADLDAHLQAALEESGGSEAAVTEALDALGPPAAIVAAATPLPAPTPTRRDVFAIMALLVGGIVLPVIGWLVGVGFLWSSPVWSTRRKLVATLVWPGGLLGVIALLAFPSETSASSCPGPGGTACVTTTSGWIPPLWLAITMLLGILIPPIVVAISLWRSAARDGVERTAAPAWA